MNLLEHELTRNRRRVEKIQVNPDPTKLRSNQMLYQLECDLRIHEMEAVRQGVPLVSGCGTTEPLIRALGLQSLDYMNAADKQLIVDHYVEATTTDGFPEKCCDRTISQLGIILKGDLPEPCFVFTSNAGCDPFYLAGIATAHRFNVPYYAVDLPLEQTEETLAYVTKQLREFVAMVEDTVPGAKYDEAKHIYLQDMNRRAIDCMHDVYNLRKRRPCPIPTQDTFRLPRLPADHPDPERMLAYHEAMRDELVARAGELGAPEEKLRVMWTCSAPYHANPFAVLDKKGAKIVVFMIDMIARFHAKLEPAYGVEQYGRRLTPLEEEARMLFALSWVGKGKRWVDTVIRVAHDLEIEAIVNFEQVGCMAVGGLGRVVADAADRELGIPTLILEGRQMVQQDYNKVAFEAKLEQFVDLCLMRKAAHTTGLA